MLPVVTVLRLFCPNIGPFSHVAGDHLLWHNVRGCESNSSKGARPTPSCYQVLMHVTTLSKTKTKTKTQHVTTLSKTKTKHVTKIMIDPSKSSSFTDEEKQMMPAEASSARWFNCVLGLFGSSKNSFLGLPKILFWLPRILLGLPRIVLRHSWNLFRSSKNSFLCLPKILLGLPRFLLGLPRTLLGLLRILLRPN